MPPQQSSVADPDMCTILNAIASCDEFNPNSKKFAEAEGINRGDNAVAKFRRIINSHGYKFENKKVAKIDELPGDGTAAETPKKAPAAKKAKTKATPTPKKRKVEEIADQEQAKDEGGEN